MVLRPKTGVEQDPRVRAYFPVGLPPMQKKPQEHFLHGMGALEMVRKLATEVPDAAIYVADVSSNFLKGNISEEEAASRAYRVAEVEQIFWEAASDIAEEETGVSIPVYIMSEVVPRDEFAELRSELWRLVDENKAFGEAVYHCVPAFLLPPDLQETSPYADLPEGKQKKKVKNKMDYVIQETVNTLILGKKLGHDGENCYDAVAIWAASFVGRPRPEFQNLVPGKDNPYRAQRFGYKRRMDGVLSATGVGFEALDLDTRFEDETGPFLDRHDRIDDLQEGVDLVKRLYQKMMAAASVKPHLRDLIADKLCREIVFCLDKMVTRPEYHYLLEESGVLDVLKGAPISTLDGRAINLPFSCLRLEGEPDSVYFVRYVASLLHDDGPCVAWSGDSSASNALPNMLLELQGVDMRHYPLPERYCAWREQFVHWWRREGKELAGLADDFDRGLL